MIDETARKLAAKAYKLASKSTTLKNNLTATAHPSVTDDEDAGYEVESIWVYDNITYTCVDSTVGKAVWKSSSDIVTFNTWSEVVAAISVLSPSYIGKYALVANANGAPSAGITYIAPNALTDYIVDGGSATLKINVQGTNYSTTTMPRTITNPIVTSVMLISSAKPTIKGYYIFTVNPTDGLPSGCNLNDICYYNGAAWSVWQSYSQATAVLVATSATGLSQVTWRKFGGSWMSTADEYIPDGLEYQTGKLWNGKPVFRKCTSGKMFNTFGTHLLGVSIPLTGEILIVQAKAKRNDGHTFSIASPASQLEFSVTSAGELRMYNNGINNATLEFTNVDYGWICWVEYTK